MECTRPFKVYFLGSGRVAGRWMLFLKEAVTILEAIQLVDVINFAGRCVRIKQTINSGAITDVNLSFQ